MSSSSSSPGEPPSADASTLLVKRRSSLSTPRGAPLNSDNLGGEQFAKAHDAYKELRRAYHSHNQNAGKNTQSHRHRHNETSSSPESMNKKVQMKQNQDEFIRKRKENGQEQQQNHDDDDANFGTRSLSKPSDFPWFPEPLLRNAHTEYELVSDQPMSQMDIPGRMGLTSYLGPAPFPTDVLPASPDEIATATGHFRRLVAKGGFGNVYYAKGLRGRYAAVKVSHARNDDDDAKSEFWKEVEVLKQCRGCEHVAQLMSYGYAFVDGEKRLALAYPWFDRGDLSTRLHRRGEWPVLTAEERHTAVTCTAMGLEAMHRRFYAHMDVSAKNVLLRASDRSACGLEAVLADPGQAIMFPGGRCSYSHFGNHGTSATPANAGEYRNDAQERFLGRTRAGAACKLPNIPDPDETADADLASDPADAPALAPGRESSLPASPSRKPQHLTIAKKPLRVPKATAGYAAPELYMLEVDAMCRITDDALNCSEEQLAYVWDSKPPAIILPLYHPAWCDSFSLGVLVLEVMTGNLPAHPAHAMLKRDARPSLAGEVPGPAFAHNARRVLLDHDGSLIEGSWDELVDADIASELGPAMRKSLALVGTAGTHPDARMRMHVSDAAAVLRSGFNAFRSVRDVSGVLEGTLVEGTLHENRVTETRYVGGYGLTDSLGLISTTTAELLDRGNAAGRAGGDFHHRHRFHERSPFEGSPGGINMEKFSKFDELRALTPRWLLDWEYFRDVDLGFCGRGGAPKVVHAPRNSNEASVRGKEKYDKEVGNKAKSPQEGAAESSPQPEKEAHARIARGTRYRVQTPPSPPTPAPSPPPQRAKSPPPAEDPIMAMRRIEEDTRWRIAYGKLEAFFVRHGHLHVPRGFPGMEDLADWLERQCMLGASGELSEDRMARLLILGVSIGDDTMYPRTPDPYGVDGALKEDDSVLTDQSLRPPSPFLSGSALAKVAASQMQIPIAAGAKGKVMLAGETKRSSAGLPRIGVASPSARPPRSSSGLPQLHLPSPTPARGPITHVIPSMPGDERAPPPLPTMHRGVGIGRPDRNTFESVNLEHGYYTDTSWQQPAAPELPVPDLDPEPEPLPAAETAIEADGDNAIAGDSALEAAAADANASSSPGRAASSPRPRRLPAEHEYSDIPQERHYVAKTRHGRAVQITMIDHPPPLDSNAKSKLNWRAVPPLLIMGDTYDSKKFMASSSMSRRSGSADQASMKVVKVKKSPRVPGPDARKPSYESAAMTDYEKSNPPTRQSTPKTPRSRRSARSASSASQSGAAAGSSIIVETDIQVPTTVEGWSMDGAS
ncbi:Rieske domain-containing protein [Pycnococcus provasolii]